MKKISVQGRWEKIPSRQEGERDIYPSKMGKLMEEMKGNEADLYSYILYETRNPLYRF